MEKVDNFLPLLATMGNDVECYNTRQCCGDCDECPLYGELAVMVVNRYFKV